MNLSLRISTHCSRNKNLPTEYFTGKKVYNKESQLTSHSQEYKKPPKKSTFKDTLKNDKDLQSHLEFNTVRNSWAKQNHYQGTCISVSRPEQRRKRENFCCNRLSREGSYPSSYSSSEISTSSKALTGEKKFSQSFSLLKLKKFDVQEPDDENAGKFFWNLFRNGILSKSQVNTDVFSAGKVNRRPFYIRSGSRYYKHLSERHIERRAWQPVSTSSNYIAQPKGATKPENPGDCIKLRKSKGQLCFRSVESFSENKESLGRVPYLNTSGSTKDSRSNRPQLSNIKPDNFSSGMGNGQSVRSRSSRERTSRNLVSDSWNILVRATETLGGGERREGRSANRASVDEEDKESGIFLLQHGPGARPDVTSQSSGSAIRNRNTENDSSGNQNDGGTGMENVSRRTEITEPVPEARREQGENVEERRQPYVCPVCFQTLASSEISDHTFAHRLQQEEGLRFMCESAAQILFRPTRNEPETSSGNVQPSENRGTSETEDTANNRRFVGVRISMGAARTPVVFFATFPDEVSNREGNPDPENETDPLRHLLQQVLSGNGNSLLENLMNDAPSETHGTPVSIIDSLPLSSYTGEEKGRGAIEEHICMICLDKYEIGSQIRCLPCMHLFHSSCIDVWLSKSLLCPACKARVDANVQDKLQSNSDIHTNNNDKDSNSCSPSPTAAEVL